MDRIRVLHLINSPAVGGVQKYVATLVKHATVDRFDCRTAYLKRDTLWAGWAAPESLVALPVKDARDNAGLRTLGRWLRNEQIDILHCHSDRPNAIGRQAAILAGVRVVIAHFHNAHGHKGDARGAAWERVLAPYTSHALMVSEQVREAVEAMTRKALSRRSTVVRAPVDLEELRRESLTAGATPDARLDAWRARGTKVVSVIGRWIADKRIDDVLRAVAALRGQGRDVALAIAGEGPEGERLRQLATELGVPDYAIFLENLAAVGPLLARTDAMVLASSLEGMPMCNLEAMACGVPVVSTPAGGAREVDPGGECILWTEHGSPDSIARNVAQLFDNPEGREGRIKKGHEIVSAFDARTITQGIEAIYERELATDRLRKGAGLGYGLPLGDLAMGWTRLRWMLARRR